MEGDWLVGLAQIESQLETVTDIYFFYYIEVIPPPYSYHILPIHLYPISQSGPNPVVLSATHPE